MLTHEENELLCRVEGNAPMGQLMRRHWMPACMIEEVAEPDGDPVRVRMLGEDLVAFRDTDGRVGVIGEHCPHRRASLLFGRNEECGLRCLYHGWKMDVDGNVVEMASEPPESRLVEKVKHIAYPTREAGGFVWVYMGPPDEMPEFEPPAFAPSDKTNVSIVKVRVPCNWAQILEGAIDSAHSSSLHSTDIPPGRTEQTTATGGVWARPTTDKSPRIQVQLTNYGFRYAAIRRPIKNSQTHDYVRITAFVAPITVLIPPNNVYSLANVNVPGGRHAHDVLFHRLERLGPGHRQGGVPQILRGARRHRPRPQLQADPHAREQLPAGPQGDEARRLHRHPRHSEPGHGDVGDDGPDRRSHARAARRERHRDRAVPSRHGRRGQAVRERRAGDRHDASRTSRWRR